MKAVIMAGGEGPFKTPDLRQAKANGSSSKQTHYEPYYGPIARAWF